MMWTKAELEEKIRLIDKANDCEEHGRDDLKICLEPGCNSVYCGACTWGHCQCSNDE